MSPSRYVAVEWIGLQERSGASRMVVRDLSGREATFPKPGSSEGVESMVALLQALGARVVKVEVHSGLSLAHGGRLYLKRRWFGMRQVDVHASLAISLAARFHIPLLIDDRVFLLETFESEEVENVPGDTERTIQ